jgi:hypothetical protein
LLMSRRGAVTDTPPQIVLDGIDGTQLSAAPADLAS